MEEGLEEGLEGWDMDEAVKRSSCGWCKVKVCEIEGGER